MDSSQIIIWMIIACCVFLFMIFFVKPLRSLFKIARNSIMGSLLLVPINFIMSIFGVTVGINLFTGIFVGLLGFPGIITLYLLAIFL